MTDGPTFDQRFSASAHVLYELTAVGDQLRLLRRMELDEKDPIQADRDADKITVAALESLLVHIRNLAEFLLGGRLRKDGTTRSAPKASDIPPSWFVTSWTYASGPHDLDLWIDLIDKQLSHLSLHRVLDEVDDDDPVIGQPPVVWTQFAVKALVSECERFDDALDREGSDFRAGFHHELERLKQSLDARTWRDV